MLTIRASRCQSFTIDYQSFASFLLSPFVEKTTCSGQSAEGPSCILRRSQRILYRLLGSKTNGTGMLLLSPDKSVCRGYSDLEVVNHFPFSKR